MGSFDVLKNGKSVSARWGSREDARAEMFDLENEEYERKKKKRR